MLHSSSFLGVSLLPLTHCHEHWALPLRWVAFPVNIPVVSHTARTKACVVQAKVRKKDIMCGCAREAAGYAS